MHTPTVQAPPPLATTRRRSPMLLTAALRLRVYVRNAHRPKTARTSPTGASCATGMGQGGCRAPSSRQTQTMLSLMARTSLTGLYTTVATTPRPHITLRETFTVLQRRTSLHLSRDRVPGTYSWSVQSERCLCRVLSLSFCLSLLALVCAAVDASPRASGDWGCFGGAFGRGWRAVYIADNLLHDIFSENPLAHRRSPPQPCSCTFFDEL